MLILNFSLLVLTNGVWDSSRSKYVFPVYDSRFSHGTVGKLGKLSIPFEPFEPTFLTH